MAHFQERSAIKSEKINIITHHMGPNCDFGSSWQKTGHSGYMHFINETRSTHARTRFWICGLQINRKARCRNTAEQMKRELFQPAKLERHASEARLWSDPRSIAACMKLADSSHLISGSKKASRYSASFSSSYVCKTLFGEDLDSLSSFLSLSHSLKENKPFLPLGGKCTVNNSFALNGMIAREWNCGEGGGEYRVV